MRCMLCGPWPSDFDDYDVTVLPPGRAIGAVNSARAQMHAQRSGNPKPATTKGLAAIDGPHPGGKKRRNRRRNRSA